MENKRSFRSIIFALGIPNVGSKTAKILAMNYETLDNLMNANIEDLTKINDIGKIIAESIIDYFNNDNNKEIINELKEIGINMIYTGEKQINAEEFYNQSFVITGTLSKYTREEVEEKISLLGGRASSSVSKKTRALILGENPGSKKDKAESLGIEIWTEEELEERFKKYE